MNKRRGDINFHWAAQVTPWGRGLQLMKFKRIEGISTHYARPLEMEWVEYKDNTFISDPPTMELETHDAQQLMQLLWDAGYRPNDGAGSTAEATALRAHITSLEKSLESTFKLLNYQIEMRALDAERASVTQQPPVGENYYEMLLKKVPYEKIADFLNDDPSARGVVRAFLKED